MRIAIIAHNLHPIKEPFAGGLEMVTFLLCKSLIKRGYSIDLYAHPNSDAQLNVLPIGDKGYRANRKDAPSLGCQPEISSGQGVVDYMDVMDRIESESYDVVHNHSLHYIPIVIGNGMDIEFITTIHTPQFEYLRWGAERVKSRCNQKFTMVSKTLAKTWDNLIPHSEVIYNGIDISKWEFVERPSGDYLFWYGRICPEKGTHHAIAAAITGKFKIIVAGPISNRGYYDQQVKDMLKSPFVEYIGHLSQSQIAPILQNAKVMLFTSTWEEPYGLTLAESLACGTPVVAFESGATREILTPKCGVIVPKNSLYKLIKAIYIAINLNRMDCRERAREFCSHENMVENYIELYRRRVNLKQKKLNISL